MEQQIFKFADLDDGDESLVIVRPVDGGVGLAMSKSADGDFEVFVPADIATRIGDALRDAAK